MSGLEELLSLCGLCFCCCFCLESVQNNNHWCFLKCCSGERYRVGGNSGGCCTCKRTMSDDEFERTIEELYGPGKFPSQGQDTSTHVVELQPTRSRSHGKGTFALATQQPTLRPSMDARAPPPPPPPEMEMEMEMGMEMEDERVRERVMLESRRGAKERTREWVVAQTSTPGADAEPQPEGSHPRPTHTQHRSESQAQLGVHSESRAHRPQQLSESHALQMQMQTRRSLSGSRAPRPPSPDQSRAADSLDEPNQPPRLDIPASLMPGRAQSSTPTQLPFDLGPSLHSRQPSAQSQVAVSAVPPERDITENREVAAD